MTWDQCVTDTTYTLLIDWNGDGGLDAGPFEGGLDDWATDGPVTISRTTTNAYTGRYSMLATWQDYTGTGTAPRIFKSVSGLTIGATYTYRAHIYMPATGMPVYLSINGVTSSAAGYTAGTWQQLAVTFTATATTHTLQILPATYPAGGANLTSNAYLVSDATGWSGNAAAIAYSTAVLAPKALGSLRVTPNGVATSGSADSTLSAAGTIVAGQSYSASMWVYSPAGWTDLRPAVNWSNAAGTFISSSLGSGFSVPAGVWTHLRQTFTAPALASRYNIRARHGGTPAVTDIYYVWGVHLSDLAQPETTLADYIQVIGPNDDVTEDVLTAGIVTSYGRNQNRQLSPAGVGNAGFSLCNVTRLYSAENTASPLYGDIGPARPVHLEVTHGGVVYPVHAGRIDDFEVHPDRANRSADITSLDGLALLQGVKISTELMVAPRTGQIINRILDAVGWTAGRDIDAGATFPRYWWAEDDNAFDAMQDVVRAEGPPAIGYVAPDGTFVFRDRHHRLQDAASLASQAVFAEELVDCDSVPVTGFDYTAPFGYEHGWRDIVNVVSLPVEQRVIDPAVSVVWSSDTPFTITAGQTVQVTASASDPFLKAVTPVSGTDIVTAGGVTVSATLSRTSGQSVVVSVTGTSGTGTVTYLQLRALAVPVSQTTKVTEQDAASMATNGERTYPESVPWAGLGDALAVAQVILAHYAQRRPIVTVRMVAQDGAHLLQILTRTLSDRVTIRNGELGLDDDFFIESVTHTIQRINTGKPPVHAVVFGCERQLDTASLVPFTFDLAGHGFNDGQFVGVGVDDPDTVFIFDDPVNGQFGVGAFGT
jgi:hypothetical protein